MASKKKRRRRTNTQKKSGRQVLKVASANLEVVEAITQRLIKTYEDYINEHPNTLYLDGFMAAHNFHAAIVTHMEDETDSDGTFVRFAKDTFSLRMEKELQKAEDKQQAKVESPIVWRKNDYLH